MAQTNPNNGKLRLGTLIIILLFTTILTACANADQEKDTSADKEHKTDKVTKQNEKFAELEEEFDAQLGIYAVDTGSNQTVEYHPEERFAYSSTFKVLAAANLLKQNDLKDLEKEVTYTEDDLVSHSPVTEKHVDSGMSLLDVSEAAIRKSDNTAGNLLLKAIGGPDKFKQDLRNMDDDITQPERYETELNEFSPENKRDTSTPKMMATDLKKVAIDNFLPDDKRELLIDWMKGNEAGDSLIRAGAPEEWTIAEKSGAGTYGTRNDIAIVWPQDKDPIIIAIMSRHDTEDAEFDDTLIEKAAEVSLNTFK